MIVEESSPNLSTSIVTEHVAAEGEGHLAADTKGNVAPDGKNSDQLLRTPDGSQSSSRSKVWSDGMESIHRWLQVHGRGCVEDAIISCGRTLYV